jgi:hypothetical protein
MIKILEIPKNASRYALFLSQTLMCEQDVSVCFLRDPYIRFWSNVKTIVDEISLFGSYPPTGLPKRTTYEGMNVDVQKHINDCVATLGLSEMEFHLQTQSSYIGDQKFDEVIVIDNQLNEKLKQLAAKYQAKTIENFDFQFVMNDSPKELDEQALAYIQSTPEVKAKLDEFYAADFALLNNLQSLKK